MTSPLSGDGSSGRPFEALMMKMLPLAASTRVTMPDMLHSLIGSCAPGMPSSRAPLASMALACASVCGVFWAIRKSR